MSIYNVYCAGVRLTDKSEILKAIEEMSRKDFEHLCLACLEKMGFDISDLKSMGGDILAEGSIQREGKIQDYIIKCTRSDDDIKVLVEGLKKILSPENKGLILTTSKIRRRFYSDGDIEIAGEDKFYQLLDNFDLLYDFNIKESSYDLIEEAERCLSQGEKNKALKLYDEAIEKGKNEEEAMLKKSELLIEEGKIEKSIQVLNGLLDIDHQNVKAWKMLGDIYHKRGEKNKALEAYEKVRDNSKKKNSSTLKKMGRMYYEIKEYEKSIECFDKILKDDPEAKGIWNNKALVHLRKGEFKKCLENLEKALSIDPKFEEAILNKALTYEKMEEYGKAVDIIDDLIDISSEKGEYHYIKGAYLTELERFEEARDSVEKTLDLDPNHKKAEELLLFLESRVKRE